VICERKSSAVTARNQTWPLYERPLTKATVTIYIRADEQNPLARPETLRACLRGDLRNLIDEGHKVDIQIEPVTELRMSLEDQAEKDALDAQVV
jgi:hypothetical protein